VTVSNDVGTNASGDQLFGIDRVPPTSAVQPLPATTPESVFAVYWGGADNLSGVRSYDIQYLDSGRGVWTDWLVGVPSSKTYELFTGQPGHTYSFRSRATDNALNTASYPTNAQTSIRIDPTTRPTTPWWDKAYALKRNITILNNMAGMTLPAGYPVHLHFDGSTAPTAAELYGASQSSPKGNDVRIICNDATQLDRVVQNFTSTAIDIWFRTQVSILGGASDNTTHQLYYGNPSAGSPPADPRNVWSPNTDGNTVGLWYYDEGIGSTTADFSSYGNHGSIGSLSWTDGKFGKALYYPEPTAGPQGVSIAGNSSLNVTSFTFEAFVKRGSVAWGMFAAQGEAGSSRECWQFMMQEGKAKVQIWPSPTAGASEVFSNPDFLPDTNWHHIAFTFDGDRTEVLPRRLAGERSLPTAERG
jgi:hypothetical protein